MTLSDLLTIFGIILAIIALISEKNREYIFLKFSKKNLIFLIAIILFVHFLISFNWFLNTFPILSFSECQYCPPSNGWAYIITIFILLWLLWKIYKAIFPLDNRERLLNYYEAQLLKGNFSFVADLIEKYHINQIVEYIKKVKEIKVNNPTGLWHFDQQEYLKEYEKKINTTELTYGNNLLFRIIKNSIFVEKIANTYPYFFTSIIIEMDNQEVKDADFTNLFLKTLFVAKNKQFFNEIRNNQNLAEFETYRIEKQRPILYSLFNNIKVAELNEVWRAVGEQAILEMEAEAKKSFSPLRETDREQDKDTIWSYRIQNAIWFFDIMIRQAIKGEITYHMWLFYYWHFTKSILKNISEVNDYEPESAIPSRNHELLESIISKSCDWIDVVIKSKKNAISKSITTCMGECVYEIAISNKLNDKTKHYLIDLQWETIITLWGEIGTEEILENIVNDYFEALSKPIMGLDFYSTEKIEYTRIMNLLYEKRDKPKFTSTLEQERVVKFKETVIDTLNQE